MAFSNLKLVGQHADDIMTERSLMRLFDAHEDPYKMTWEQLRDRFTSHDLARIVRFFLDKTAAEGKVKEAKIIIESAEFKLLN